MPSCCGSLVPPSTATEYNLGLAGFTDSGCPGVSRGCGRGGGAGCVQARVHLDALEAVRLREQLDEAIGESKFERAVRVLDDVARHYVAPAKEVAVLTRDQGLQGKHRVAIAHALADAQGGRNIEHFQRRSPQLLVFRRVIHS